MSAGAAVIRWEVFRFETLDLPYHPDLSLRPVCHAADGQTSAGESCSREELVSTILISNLASISIESEDVPITASLIPLFLIAALELLGSVVSFRSQKFFNFLSGRPKTVILDGKIDQNALRMLRLTTALLYLQALLRCFLLGFICPCGKIRIKLSNIIIMFSLSIVELWLSDSTSAK